MRRIAIEEHYTDADLLLRIGDNRWNNPLGRKLADMTGVRIDEMDAAGIDVQILSVGEPGVQNLAPEEAAPLARVLNDRLHVLVQERPDRFKAFAALPTSAPEAAADELQRCIERLGFVGPMISGLSRGEFLDLPKYRPIFQRAAALDVPVYIHPGVPHSAVTEVYYKDYLDAFPNLTYAPLGFTVETSVQAVRLIISGIFDELPGLKIVLGHFGEGIPFLLRRIDKSLRRSDHAPHRFREIFTNNFYVTTSGFFSDAALTCSIAEMNEDRILFAVDWPWGNNADGVKWLDNAPVSEATRRKIYSQNAERLFKL